MPCTGELENFRIKDGDSGASLGFIVTLIGRDNPSSCFGGILSGGPIGLSSRFRFFFFSIFDRSSERFDKLLPPPPPPPILLPTLLLLLLPLDDRFSLMPLLFIVELIGVIVMEDFIFGAGLLDIGIISMPRRFSKPVKTELNSTEATALFVVANDVPMGVILNDCDSLGSSNLSSDFLIFFRMDKLLLE